MNPFYKNLSLWVVILLMMFLLYNILGQQQTVDTRRSYSEFIIMVENDQVNDVLMQGNELTVTDKNNTEFNVIAPDDNEMIKLLKKQGVSIKVQPPAETSWFIPILSSWLPLIVLIGIWVFFMRQMQGGGGKAMSFGKSRARLSDDKSQKVTFDDVAGIDEAKEELEEVVDFLKDPHKFTRLGGRIPKGVLLVGSPGTGKTLLSRAIAGEADVPFFTISGSDFVEMFVGVGASRVRDLFAQGKKNAPCIIFIDEIDAVGRQRGAGLGGGHDEREQTLNQLLVEMDGFEANEGVIMIAATNRADVLDPALLRPGRFDRQVMVDLPDIKGRAGILAVHMKKTPLGKDVDLKSLAKGTPGFSGADLENLVNEAALLAAKRDQEKLQMKDFEDAKDKVYMGLERKSKVMKEEDRKTTAYHEAGHAVVARFLPHSEAVNKVTIIPRGRAAGVTWFFPDESDFRYKDQLESRLAIAMGGRVAEELVFNRISTGASNDIKQATRIAKKMVCEWGMSNKLGPLAYSSDSEQVFIGRDMGQRNDYSEQTARIIDEEISNLVQDCYDNATTVLNENLGVLHKVSETLLEKETISGAELDEIILSVKPDAELCKHDDYVFDEKEEFKTENKKKVEAKPEETPVTAEENDPEKTEDKNGNSIDFDDNTEE